MATVVHTRLLDLADAPRTTDDPTGTMGIVPIDVFLIAGQSNAVGHSLSADRALYSPVPADGTAIQWNGTTFVPAIDPVGTSGSEPNHGSAWPAFAIAYYKASGRRVAFVPKAVDGSSLLAAADTGSGNWSTTGALYAAAVAAVTAATLKLTELGYLPIFKGVCWSQGETDAVGINAGTAGVTKANYKAELLTMISNLRTEYGATVPFYNFQVGTWADGGANHQDAGFAQIRAAQDEVVAADIYTYNVFLNAKGFQDRDECIQGDKLHYTQTGYNEMGRIGATGILVSNAHNYFQDVTVTAARSLAGGTYKGFKVENTSDLSAGTVAAFEFVSGRNAAGTSANSWYIGSNQQDSTPAHSNFVISHADVGDRLIIDYNGKASFEGAVESALSVAASRAGSDSVGVGPMWLLRDNATTPTEAWIAQLSGSNHLDLWNYHAAAYTTPYRFERTGTLIAQTAASAASHIGAMVKNIAANVALSAAVLGFSSGATADAWYVGAVQGSATAADSAFIITHSGVGDAITISKTGTVTVGANVQVTGFSAPASGSGVEVAWTGTEGVITAYNRTAPAYLPLYVGGLTTAIQANGATVGTFSATGLAVTGALSTTGITTIGTTTSANNIRLAQKLAVVGITSGLPGAALVGWVGVSPTDRPILDLSRSRGVTEGSFTATASGDHLGSLIFRGSDGAAFRDGAAVLGIVDAAVSAGAVPTCLTFNTGSSALTERMRINSSGNIGIVSGAKFNLDGLVATGDTYIVESSANVLDLYAGGVNALRLASTGATVTGALNTTGTIVSTAATGILTAISGTTGAMQMRLKNTGNDVYWGIESSVAGAYYTGASAYAAVTYVSGGKTIESIIGGVKILGLSSDGAAVTGALSTTGIIDVRNIYCITGTPTAVPGLGGNFRVRNDTGAAAWLAGILGGAAATSYDIYDIVNAKSVLTITASAGTSAVTVTGTLNATGATTLGGASSAPALSVIPVASQARWITATGSVAGSAGATAGEPVLGTNAGAIKVPTTLQITGITTPLYGEGVEVAYSGGVGNVISYKRTATASYMPLALSGSTVTINTGTGVPCLSMSDSGSRYVAVHNHNTAPYITTSAGDLELFSATGVQSVNNGTFTARIGYRDLYPNTKAIDYTCVAVDAGCLMIQTGASKTFTIPAQGAVDYPVGAALSFTCGGGAVSIAITTDTMYLAGTATTGTRTLANLGVATAVKVNNNSPCAWIIFGAGLT